MTREETQRILAAIQTAYPGFRVENKKYAVDLWTEMLSDLSYEQVSKALQYFISTDTKGFAPSIGQIRASVQMTEPVDWMDEGQAWALVYNALSNSNYHSREEFNRLPPDVRRAVGGPSALQAWAVMDENAITVAESNFKRAYRAVMETRKRDAMLPDHMKVGLPEAPVAMIEAKEEKHQQNDKTGNAPEILDELLKKWGIER